MGQNQAESHEAKPGLLVITGPTASGKTTLAVEVAKTIQAEIVGADSMQVYRGLDIGTAKPTQEELQGIPHHLIDVAEPEESFDAARFVTLADKAIAHTHQQGLRVIVAGGTGLYIRALLHGLHQGPAPVREIRDALQAKAQAKGWPAMHEELKKVDPDSADRLHPNDGVRILRALEVFLASGKPMSHWQQQHGFQKQRYPALVLGILRPRKELNQRIEDRVDEMMADGFKGEVEKLLSQGKGPTLKPMQGLGYRRIVEHLNGELPMEETVEKIKTDTRRFAKRQMTWFKQEKGLVWIDPDITQIVTKAKDFFSQPCI